MADDGQYVIQSLDVALDVLEYLGRAGDNPPRPSEIARQLGITRARAFRILKTLEPRHYVRSDPKTGGYRLGFKCLRMSEQVRAQTDVRREAEPLLIELARVTGDTVVLVVLDGSMSVDVAGFQGDHQLQAGTRIGERNPLYIGASNKVLLAYLPEEERERIIQDMKLTPYTDKTITCRDELRRRLAEIRSQGYEVDEDSYEIGVHAIAAPVRDHIGRVVAGVTVTTPRARYNSQRCQELIERVVGAADGISARLGQVEGEAGK